MELHIVSESEIQTELFGLKSKFLPWEFLTEKLLNALNVGKSWAKAAKWSKTLEL